MTNEAAVGDHQAAAELSYRADGSLAARIVVTGVGIVTMTGAYIADWNVTHIYNPTWPPHAKFHNAQTMLLAAALGLCTLVYAWRRDATRVQLRTAIVFASLYWFTQLGSITFPGTGFVDPDRAGTGLLLGIPAQLVIDFVLLTLLGVALLLARRRTTRASA